MDLSNLSGISKIFNEGVWVTINHPTDGAIFEVKVASYLSDKVKAVKRRIQDGAAKEIKKNPRKVTTAQEWDEHAAVICAAAVLDWRDLEGKPLNMDGQLFECNAENIKTILTNLDFYFIAEQIDKAASDETLFFMK